MITDILDPVQLARKLELPLIELEPFLIEVRYNGRECSIESLFKWIHDYIQEETFHTLENKDISWILLMRIANDSEYKDLLTEDDLNFIEDFIQYELNKVCSE